MADKHLMFLRREYAGLGKNFFHNPAMHIGKAEVPATITIGQFFMIQAHKVQNGGMKIVNVDLAIDSFVAVFIGGTMGHSTPYPTPC